jgi:hypothetical protein
MVCRFLAETNLTAEAIIDVLDHAGPAAVEQSHDDQQFAAGAAAASALRNSPVPSPDAIAEMYASGNVPVVPDAQFAAEFAKGAEMGRHLKARFDI